MPESLSIDFNQPVPLFPVPNCVLLPHATIQLHIFEPRYRAMTRDAIEGNRLIAIAAFAGDDWRQDYDGCPPLRRHVCVGFIVKHEQLPDGRFNILLQGVCRARISEEIPPMDGDYEFDGQAPPSPYRRAILEPTETEQPMEIDISEQRQRLERLLNDGLLTRLSSVSAVHNWLSREIPTVVLVDLAIMTVCDNIDQRYDMLEQTDVFKRASWLEKHLCATRKTLEAAELQGSGKSEDGFALN